MRKNGMDAYMFLRFIRLLVVLFASITILSCGILLPVDTAGLHDASSTDKLAQLSWGKYVAALFARPCSDNALDQHTNLSAGPLRSAPRRHLDFDLCVSSLPPEPTRLIHGHPVWALYLIRRELKHYARTRQEFLISPSHSCLAQARTVLITNVPPELCNERDLRRWASFVPGGVQDVWLYRDTKVC